jgi:lysozyme
MILTPEVLKKLKHHEGVRLKPYLCPAHIWTIGVGHVLYQDQIKLPMARVGAAANAKTIRKDYPLKGPDNRVWTMEEVDELLAQDLKTFTRGVDRLVNGRATIGQFGALVSFAFNVGLGNLQRSTIRQKHLRGDYEGAAEAFMMWTKAGGRELPGLVNRRKDERALYLS